MPGSLAEKYLARHGIGHAKRDFLLESVGDRQMQLMSGIKSCLTLIQY